MARGGKRQGTPGKLYGNRTDMNADRAPTTGLDTPGAGGVPAPPAMAPPSAPAGPLPGQVTALDAPTDRPDEPITAGLPMGAGPGPTNQSRQDLLSMRQYLPYLAAISDQPDTPLSVRAFTQYLQSLTP